jgi:hypothetical protein
VPLKPTAALALALLCVGAPACVATSGVGRAAVSMRMQRTDDTPKDASVYIDEEYVAPLYVVQSHGVRLPVGEHRITVQKEGYFPYDRFVKANRQDIFLEVELAPVPD